MSLAQIKREVKTLSLDQRMELADYLARQEKASKAARRARIERRMKSMDRGRKFTQEQVQALHSALRSVGL